MPRKSHRKKTLEAIDSFQEAYSGYEQLEFIERLSSDGYAGDTEEDNSISDLVKHMAECAKKELDSCRYLAPRVQRSGRKKELFVRDLDAGDSENPPWLNDDEFLQKYRMSRQSFHQLVGLIENHAVFKPKPTSKWHHSQAPVAWQLMVYLRYIGSSASGGCNANVRNTFDIGRGTAETYKKRCIEAIRSLSAQFVYWPIEEERKKIEERFRVKYNLPGCVAVADGTLFPLTYAPQCKDAADYSGRKYPYSLSTMIVNDDKKRVRYFLAGFPGSAHDQKVFSYTCLSKQPDNYFNKKQYLIADSALLNSPSVVSSFKAPRGEIMGPREEKFNSHLACCRIISEHTIGLLKGRFPWLRSIPMRLTDSPTSLKRILRVIESIMILHNFLLMAKDSGEQKMMQEEDEMDDGGISEDELEGLLQMTIENQAQSDERRANLMFYLEEYVY